MKHMFIFTYICEFLCVMYIFASGGLSLSRTLGDMSTKVPPNNGLIIHDCEMSITPIDASCLFMVFGSDGLWDVMNSQVCY